MSPSTTLSDPLLSPSADFFANPYPTFDKLRSEAPVFWSEKGEYWLVTRFDDVYEVTSSKLFEKGAKKIPNADALTKMIPAAGELMQFRSRSMLLQNPPDHTRLRSLVNKAFTPTMVSELKPRIEAISTELITHILSKSKKHAASGAQTGEFDLINDFAFPLPATVIAEMLGIPASDRDKFKEWSHAITIALDPNPEPSLMNLAKVAGGYKSLISYLRPLLEERRKSRKDDLISSLIAAEEDGNRLDEVEILSNVILLLIAGHETTTNLIGNGMLALLRNPQQMELLKATPDLMPSAITEFLRYDSPVQFVRRIATQDVEIGGVTIGAQQVVIALLGAANHDPAHFAAPDKLDIMRQDNKHIAFGHGIHHCLGWSLAETEGQIAIATLLRSFPNLKLKSEKVEFKQPFSLRGLKHLHLTY